ncbi:MAG: CRTAC1 family protein [Schlesneria sp.]
MAKPSSALLRLIAVVVVAALLVGLEVVRLTRQRIVEKRSAISPSLTSTGIECLGTVPAIIRQNKTPSFVDVTRVWDLDFQHAVGPLGTYFMPESVGTGGALLDYDGDGRLDLYLVQSSRSPGVDRGVPDPAPFQSRLFRQSKEGVLVDVTRTAGLEGKGYGVGCAVGDVDNDGDPDLYVTRYDQDSLYLNNADGTFSDATETCGIVEHDWGTCAAFFDYNRDGLLDLIVINYTYDPTYGHSVACGFRQGLVSYCGPRKFEPTIDRLYRNDGLQTDSQGHRAVKFTDVTEVAGLSDVKTYGFGVVCADFTGDGWPDIFVANDGAANRLWINQQNGTFLEEAAQRGCATNAHGAAEAGMGVAIGDVNHDARLDLIVTHLSGERAPLSLDKGEGVFEDASVVSRIVRPTMRHTGWGAGLIDFNHDGELDFAVTNGLVIPCHSGFPAHGEDKFQVRHDAIANPIAFWHDYADQNLLLFGAGSGLFNEATMQGGDFCAAVGSGRGLIHGDIDNDGDIDLIVTNCGGPAKLYRNDFTKGGSWLMARAIDPRLKRDAYGAEITLYANGVRYHACVNPASSFLASNDVRVHFGLSNCKTYDKIEVKWPDGSLETANEVFDGGLTNRHIELQRGTGRELKGIP